MKAITSLDLYKAKEKCVELQKSNNRLILKGNSPILLTTTLLKKNPKFDDDFEMFEVFPRSKSNHVDVSYLDALTMYLNENYGVNGVIDYLPIADDIFKVVDQLSVYRHYNDKEIRQLILDNNIQALYSLKVDKVMNSEPILIAEKMSSYSFMGLTGISEELSKKLKENNLPNHMQFGGNFGFKDFKDLGYDYTDDTIEFNDLFRLGVIKRQTLPKEKIWPRTVEISFRAEDDTYNLERVGSVLIDYFAWVEKELKEKGPANAMSPMKPKTYQKN